MDYTVYTIEVGEGGCTVRVGQEFRIFLYLGQAVEWIKEREDVE